MPHLVALNMPGGPRFVGELNRAWDNGDAVLPIDTRLPRPAVDTLLGAMGAAELVDGTGERHRLDTGRPTEPGDALVMATSGSTGVPKGVVHTHATVAASATITSRRLGVTGHDHWLACLPLSHIGGLSVITRAIYSGTQLTVHSHFDPDSAIACGANFVSLVPTALRRIDAAKFKVILLGGTSAPEDRPANTVITYGSTETGSGIVYERDPLEGVELRVQDGELLVKSPTLLRCYRDGTDPRDANGWFHTGDAASLDKGYLEVFGRIAEVINTGGEKVWPAAVESALKSHPSIREAFVFGAADPEWGQRVVARIELDGDVAAPALEEVREHVKQALPAYAAPKDVRVVTEIARTTSGKVDRSESARI